MTSADHAVLTWDTARPKLRDDLVFHFQMVEGRPTYVVEDRINRAYHQIGVPEYRFLRSLDGSKPAAQLLAERSNRKDSLSETEIESLLRWVIDHHLFEPAKSEQADRRLAHAEEAAPKQKKQSLLRLFFLKIPLGSPEAFLRRFTALLAWTLSPLALLAGTGVLLYGVVLVVTNYEILFEASSRALIPQNWLWLIAATVFLKLVHEIWHGVACQKFGGVVPEWGVQVISWISPLTYIDATSSWSFPSRWRRIIVAGAGMYIELLIAVAALHFWLDADPGTLKEIAFNLLVSASLVTLLFNANPLMRFDGYYILSDLLDVRNLGQRGQQAFAWLNRRLFLGLGKQGLAPVLRKRFFLYTAYGALSWVWRIAVLIGLLALAANLFQGMGLFALALSSLLFVAGLIHSFMLSLQSSESLVKIPWGTASWRIGTAAGLVALALVAIPVNPSAEGYAVVEYTNKAVIRTGTPGFLAAIHAPDGSRVEAGAPLVSLRNEEESARLRILEAELAWSEAKARIHYLGDRFDEWQTEREKTGGLREKVTAQKTRLVSLDLTSPIAGRVHAPDLANREDAWFATGAPVVTIIPDEAPGFVISLRQQDFQRIAAGLAAAPQPFAVRLAGRPGQYEADLQRTDSKASLAIPNPVLASSAGGPLPVRGIDQKESAARSGGLARGNGGSGESVDNGTIRPEASREGLELLRPRFTVYASVRDADGLREGEWGNARYEGTEREALGRWLWRLTISYLERQFLSPK